MVEARKVKMKMEGKAGSRNYLREIIPVDFVKNWQVGEIRR
jgi:hypothetical protein